MSKIKNMKMLRDKVLETLDELESGKIDISEASTIAKLSETIISGLRSEMQYSMLINSQPKIEFFGEPSGIKMIDPKNIKKLL